MSGNDERDKRDETGARSGLKNRLLKALLSPLFGTKDRLPGLQLDSEVWQTAASLPPATAEPLLDLLLDLRAQRIATADLWSRWDALPAEDPGQLAALRDFIKSWLYWRDRGVRPGFGGWPTEDWERARRRTLLDLVILILQRKYRPPELAAATAPDGRGDETTPAEERP